MWIWYYLTVNFRILLILWKSTHLSSLLSKCSTVRDNFIWKSRQHRDFGMYRSWFFKAKCHNSFCQINIPFNNSRSLNYYVASNEFAKSTIIQSPKYTYQNFEFYLKKLGIELERNVISDVKGCVIYEFESSIKLKTKVKHKNSVTNKMKFFHRNVFVQFYVKVNFLRQLEKSMTLHIWR